MKTGLYAGSFDPPTRGHAWMIRQGLGMFDRLIVAIGDNPTKDVTFAVEDRLAFLSALIDGEFAAEKDRIEVVYFPDQYLAEYAVERGASAILRGIRGENDFMNERKLQRMHQQVNPSVRIVYLIPPQEISEISSSTVKSLVGFGGWQQVVRAYLPESLQDSVIPKLAR